MLGYEGNATFDSTGDEVGQRKGSWPIWITLEEEGKCPLTELQSMPLIWFERCLLTL